METGIDNLKDLIEVIVGIVGAGSLAFAAYTYFLNKKQLNFAVIVSCTERFQKIMSQLKSDDKDLKLKALKQYVDLCNEELFYFKNGYLPKEIVDEWLDGMTYYLPYIVNGRNFNTNSEYADEIIENNLLNDYPNLKNAFTFNQTFDIESETQRLQLVTKIKTSSGIPVKTKDKLMLK